MKTVRIGSGAGYGGDRLEPALELIEKGNLDYIIFECLAERTIAIAQGQKRENPEKGYNGLLEYRMEKVLPLCKKHGVKVVTNMGAANPEAAAKVVKKMAQDMGIEGLKIAAVIGDDISDQIEKYLDYEVLEFKKPLKSIQSSIISANAYLGSEGILEALQNDADIIITGRVADPSLTLAPLMHEFGWTFEKADLLGKGILAGHLLECAGQVTGGYYADPGVKDVPDLWKLGFPIAIVDETGEIEITKVDGSGGLVTTDTCKEQMIYEIHDPSKYITPDGIADYTGVKMTQVGKDRVAISGATGTLRPETLKVSIGYQDCYIGEGEISYGGSNAFNRAKLAGEIVRKRLELVGVPIEELRIDYIGFNSLYSDAIGKNLLQDTNVLKEVRLRVSGRTFKQSDATQIANEVEALYTNGPAGGGGATKKVSPVVSIASIFMPREDINVCVKYEEV